MIELQTKLVHRGCPDGQSLFLLEPFLVSPYNTMRGKEAFLTWQKRNKEKL